MRGYYPNRLDISLEIAKDGVAKLRFKEWHDFATKEQFTLVSKQTEATAKIIMEQHKHLKLDVDFKVHPKEKSYEILYTGKDVRPGISAIIFELMPQLVRNETDAFKTVEMFVEAIKVALKMELLNISAVKEH